MEGEGNGEEKKLSVAVEKIKLIDIFTEDDDFLVASPLCGSLQDSFFSGFENSSPELEILQYKEMDQLHSDFVKISRSSFHRKSIAWDSAFFDSPGVLDSDELSRINKGLQKTKARLLSPFAKQHRSRKTHNVANRGLEEAGLKGGDGLQNMPSLKNVDRSVRNKSSATRRQERLSSPEPPKALGRNIRTASRDRELSLKSYNVKMENSSTKTTGSGNKNEQREAAENLAVLYR
ncbi:hypothetical protein OROHE_025039 [Orobanche hederae]